MERDRIYVSTLEGEEENIAYVIEELEEGFEMKRSNNNMWSSHVRGEKIGEIKDDGSDIILMFAGRPDLKLDYSELFELKVILDYYYRSDTSAPVPVKFMKEL
jgi:hypothetical protein